MSGSGKETQEAKGEPGDPKAQRGVRKPGGGGSAAGTPAGALLITGPSPSAEGTGLRLGMAKKHPLSILLV